MGLVWWEGPGLMDPRKGCANLPYGSVEACIRSGGKVLNPLFPCYLGARATPRTSTLTSNLIKVFTSHRYPTPLLEKQLFQALYHPNPSPRPACDPYHFPLTTSLIYQLQYTECDVFYIGKHHLPALTTYMDTVSPAQPQTQVYQLPFTRNPARFLFRIAGLSISYKLPDSTPVNIRR